tara:strand:- start:37546 stop:38403 length:858 start_codon:yes stop_codon:yes gene_type:complete
MDSFFSIVYLTLNASLKEKVSVGLLMSNSEQSIFKISETKLGIIKQLMPKENYNILKSYFKSIKAEINKSSTNYKEIKLDLQTEGSNNWISKEYFNYLHRYSNNLVQFSEAKKIDISLNSSVFEVLFSKYVFEKEEENIQEKHREDILGVVKENLYPRIKLNVNIDAIVNPFDFKELISPVNINFLGKNGEIVSGQTIDFSKRYVDLERDLTKYISFTKAVDYEKGGGHYFLVGDEPQKKNDKNHAIWKHIFESHIVHYVDVSETDLIQEYVKSKGVQPYFDETE